MEKIITTFQRLKDYSLWYYFRYFPSNKRLEQKLREKTKNNTELVEQVITDISHLFQEEEIVRTKIAHYLFRNKNLNYIHNSLAKKLFPRELVEQLLQNEFIREGESVLEKDFVMRKVQNYYGKGKSRYYTFSHIAERSEDRELVSQCINKVFWEEGERENIEKELNKIWGKYKKEKIIEKLLRKWFRYDDVKEVMGR